jgi:OOP family OmpA-OmpF porin
MTTDKRKAIGARTPIIVVIGVSWLIALCPMGSLAQTVQVQHRWADSVTEPPLAQVADYWVSATLQSGGAIIFDGYAPDEELRTKLSARPNARTQWLRLGSGAPKNYTEALDFGLSVMDRLAEGRFALRENVVTLNGTARSAEDFVAITKAVATDMPSGLVLASAEILAPPADTYEWRAQKSSDGAVVLSGMVPDPTLGKILLASAGPTAEARFSFASGQPDDFQTSTRTGIGFLQRLEQGQVSFDGKAWVLSGTASTQTEKTAIETEFERQRLAASGWSLAVATPVAQDEPRREVAMDVLGTPAAETWKTDIAPVAEPSPGQQIAVAAPARPPANSTDATGSARCEAPLAEFSARNAILFRSGAAQITPDSASALDELATNLGACPAASIHVEGHTDADGDEQLNLALSVARAEAVVRALIERGIAPERLYALGYGESNPIGDNTTAEGKALNRRIVVKIASEP